VIGYGLREQGLLGASTVDTNESDPSTSLPASLMGLPLSRCKALACPPNPTLRQ